MLLRLYVRNYAIIDELEIAFCSQLNVITGETGAGKSILLGALSLILGGRADTSVLQDKKGKSVIEGTFRLPSKEDIHQFFSDNELEEEPETIIRREILPSGKSRAFINDTPVNLQQLNSLGVLLVDLHQQFDTLQLNRSDFQLEIIDALAANKSLLDQYREKYHGFSIKQRELDELSLQTAKNEKETDYDQFLFDELDRAAFINDELETLEKELQLLEHAEELKNALSDAVNIIDEGDPAVIALLRQMKNLLEGPAKFHPGIPPLVTRIESVYIELQDISSELQNLDSDVYFDAERITFIQQRVDTGYKLLKKHGVQTTNELLDVKETLQKKLEGVRDAGDAIKKLEKECAAWRKEAQTLAEQLTASRKTQFMPFTEKTNALLRSVGMKGASVSIDLKRQALAEYGQDQITFLFDANKSGNFNPLSRVASGGELNRLMLCIKSLVASSVSLPTLIFDEIDSGISGEAARQVGRIMKDLSETHQVICITHQPQIAGKAHSHFQVYKKSTGGKVLTHIRQLSQEERIHTIAQMLSGEKPGQAALANARELMD